MIKINCVYLKNIQDVVFKTHLKTLPFIKKNISVPIIKYFSILLFLLFSSSLIAQTISTDRPDQTESAATVRAGSFQIESGVLVGFEEENQQRLRQLLIPTTLIRYGIKRWVEIRLVNQLERLKKLNQTIVGISNLELGTKIGVFSSEHSPHQAAILSHLIMPTATLGLDNNEFGWINKLLVAHTLSEKFSLSYNLGYSIFEKSKPLGTYTLSFGIRVNPKVGIYAEFYGNYSDFTEINNNFDAGFTYLIRPYLQLDYSFGVGINNRMNYVSVGCSWLARGK